MKKLFFILAATTIILAGTICTSCNSTPTEKVINAQKDVNEANKDLEVANAAYLADIENYRKETSDKIMSNDKAIADFKVRIADEKQNAKDNYLKRVAELEQKNTDMKKKMDDYKADNKEKWQTFKAEFNHDMDELGDAFKGLTIKNNK
jgi:septal ring factor EnvC (AmiA/AmiB activator)